MAEKKSTAKSWKQGLAAHNRVKLEPKTTLRKREPLKPYLEDAEIDYRLNRVKRPTPIRSNSGAAVNPDLDEDDDYDKAVYADENEKSEPANGAAVTDELKEMRRHSEYFKISRAQVDAFLKQAVPKDRDQALEWFLESKSGMLRPSHIFFYRTIPLTSRLIRLIWTHAQKSEFWRKARYPRKTGSQGGSVIDWNKYCNPKQLVYRNVYGEFIENEATAHGNAHEKIAGQVYIEQLQRCLNFLFIKQRGFETGHILFRGATIPLHKEADEAYYRPPRARMWHIGMVTDPFNHWRGVSIDGLVTINDIPLIIVEIKCPYGSFGREMVLYVNEPMYYFTQSQDNLYTMLRYCKTLGSCDRVTYSPIHGLNVDTHVLDPDWYLHWYAPRELRHYFVESIKCLTERAMQEFFKLYQERDFTEQGFLAFVTEKYALPTHAEPTAA